MDWFRVYHDIIDDPKILALQPSCRWFYVALLSVASRLQPRGSLPSRKDIAIHLRLRDDYANRTIDLLIKSGLIEQDVKTKALRIHSWDKRQCKSDDSYARVKRFRSANGNVSETLPRVRASDTDTDTDTEGEKNPLPPTLVLGDEFKRLGFLAEELGGDPSYAMWVSHSGRLGFPVEWIEAALRRCPKAKLGIDYLSGILRGYQREGGPPKDSNGVKSHEKLPPTPEQLAAESEEIKRIEERKRRQWANPKRGAK